MRTKTGVLIAFTATLSLGSMPAAASVAVSPAGVRFPALDVNSGGRTVVAWERRSGGRFWVEARIGRGARSLGDIRRFGPGLEPRVAVAEDGAAAIAWREAGGAIRAAIAARGNGFGRVQTIQRGGANRSLVGVAVQPGGRAVAVFRSGGELRFATASRGRRFGASRTLASTGPAGVPSLARDPRDGTVLVAFTTPVAPGTNAQAAVATLAPRAAAFSAPVVLTPNGIDAEGRGTAVAGPGGTAVAITVTKAGVSTLQLARRGADGAFSAGDVGTHDLRSGMSFPAGFTAALPAGASPVPAYSLETYENDTLVRARTFAGGQPLTPETGIASTPSAVATGAEAFVASAVRGGPVVVAIQAGMTVTRRTLTSRGDGDALLAARGERVLAAFQRDDRLRLEVVR